MQVSLQDFQNYVANNIQPDGIEFVGYFRGGPPHCGVDFNNLLKLVDAKQQIYSSLDQLFASVDWSRSFDHALGIIYDEVLEPEALIHWHYWLRTKSADIQNIYLFLTHSIGAREWWQNWCNVNRQKSFVLVDSLPSLKWVNRIIVNNPDLPLGQTTQDVCNKINRTNFWFSYFGGPAKVAQQSYVDRFDRLYLTLEMLMYHEYALIDFASLPSNINGIEQYIEYITYFKNQDAVEEIKNRYNRFIANAELKSHLSNLGLSDPNTVFNPRFKLSGIEYEINQQCFASVIRETLVDGCINTFTEKSCRPFFNYCMAIPTGFLSVEQLQERGFWFPTDLIDYSYQYEPDFYQRTQLLKQSLGQLVLMPINELRKYAYEHVEQLLANHQQVVGMKNLESLTTGLPI